MGQKQEKWTNKDSDELFRTILGIKDLDEARRFFRDLLTESEIIEFGPRFSVAPLFFFVFVFCVCATPFPTSIFRALP